MSNHVFILVFIIVLLLAHSITALNILAIVSLPLGSHYMAFQNLFRELAVRGHNVTVMNNFPDKNPPPNLKFVDLQMTSNKTRSLESYENIDATHLRFLNIYRHLLATKVNEDCEKMFSVERNNNVNYYKNIKYDVIFVEQFVSDCGLVFAATFYDASIIGITSHVPFPWAYPRLGIPFDIAADAFYLSNAGPNPSLLQKLEVTLVKLVINTIGMWYKQTLVKNVYDKYLPNNSLDIEWVAKNKIQMMFVYQHFSITGARLLAPQMLEIAGIHIGTPKPVSEEIENFLADAKHGAIYVSFGSNLKASTMSKNKLQQFLTAFKKMPYKVIWKWENASLPAGYENIYTSSWFPQLDILCHPKVKAFISHGGMLSISEAAHCGKPVITIPFFGDQFSNSAAVRSVGLGKTMFFDRLNAENLEENVRELMSDEMQQNAQRVSRQWHDRPQPVMDSAIYWTEYVARHGSSPPSLPSKNNTWFESSLIDVYLVIILILFAIGLLFYTILKLLKFILVKLICSVFCNTKPKRD